MPLQNGKKREEEAEKNGKGGGKGGEEGEVWKLLYILYKQSEDDVGNLKVGLRHSSGVFFSLHM